jgi:hypothetical protein
MEIDSGAGAAASAAPALAAAIAAPVAAPLPAPSLSHSLVASSAASIPRDAQSIEALLQSMGLPPGSYQPKVVLQLLEFSQRYQRTILDEALEYSRHRDPATDKPSVGISTEDVELAVQRHMDEAFTAPPPKEVRREKTTEHCLQGLQLMI